MIDFIINTKSLTAGGLVIRGTATTNHLDKHGESITISPNAFKQSYKKFIDKGGKIMAEHGFERKYGNRQLGNVLNMEYAPEDYSIDSPKPLEMKIDVVANITDQELIQDILANKKTSFSLNWKTLNWLTNQKTKQRIDTEVEINELTVTGDPANPKAKFTVVTDEELAKQYKLGERVKVFDTIGNVKTVYVDNDNHYYVDVEFEDEIVNMKTASKIPFELINKKSKNYGCVMAKYKDDILNPLTKIIRKEDLYVDPNDPIKDGIEKNPHTTLLYGLLPSVTKEQIENVLFASQDWTNVFTLVGTYNTKINPKCIGVTIFEKDDYDVLVLEMADERFNKANELLKTLPYESEYPDYIAHTTLAYLQKGNAEGYRESIKEIAKNISFNIESIIFSSAEQNREYTVLQPYRVNIKSKYKVNIL